MTSSGGETVAANSSIERAFHWLDTRPAWQFLLALYITRWLILVPYLLATNLISSYSEIDDAAVEPAPSISGTSLFLWVVITAPIIETLIECAIPYAVISKVRKYRQRGPRRPWGFVVMSALIMTLFHPVATALIPAFITGLFLAYTYAHFARIGILQAILATFTFHAAINVVGYVMLATM